MSSKCIHVSGTMVSVIRSDLAFLWKFKTFQLVLSSLVYAEQVSNGLIDDLHLLTFNNDIFVVHREFINRKTHDIWGRTISHLDLCHFHGVYICTILYVGAYFIRVH